MVPFQRWCHTSYATFRFITYYGSIQFTIFFLFHYFIQLNTSIFAIRRFIIIYIWLLFVLDVLFLDHIYLNTFNWFVQGDKAYTILYEDRYKTEWWQFDMDILALYMLLSYAPTELLYCSHSKSLCSDSPSCFSFILCIKKYRKVKPKRRPRRPKYCI